MRLMSALLCAGVCVSGASAVEPYFGFGGVIPDNEAIGNLAAVIVEESFPITSIEVGIVGLDHGYSSDLTIELRHSTSGKRVTLVSNLRNGEDADFFGKYVFADGGADLWATALGYSGTEDLPEGVYRPSGVNNAFSSLDSAFIGEEAQGTWVLRVYDDDFLVVGSYESWELTLGGRPLCPGDVEGDVNGDGEVDIEDLLDLLRNFGDSCEES